MADIKLRFAVITISDRCSRGERDDLTGPALTSAIKFRGWEVLHTSIIPDDIEAIRQALIQLADDTSVHVVLTAGGTGFTTADVTPEATLSILEKQAPGLQEAIRMASLKITPHGMLSRGVAGIRSQTLIVNLPGSPKAAVEGFSVLVPVLPHAVGLMVEPEEASKDHSAPSTHR